MNKTARIIINLGAPDRPDTASARKFLFEFLSDKRVLSLPQPLRATLAFLISRRRKLPYAKNLERIFKDGVHPLKFHTENLAKKISQIDGKPVYVAYRYGANNITKTVETLKRSGVKYFTFIPLYPQQTCSTTDSAIARLKRVLAKSQYKVAKPYFDDPSYITALASTVPSKSQTLVVSFHSVPIAHTKGSAYVTQCKRTTELLGKMLEIADIHLGWQSAMPKGEWLKPSTEEVVMNLLKLGRKSITVIAPSFACDCSETLIELGHDLKEKFLKQGGEKFHLCHSLNDTDIHARLMAKIFKFLETKL